MKRFKLFLVLALLTGVSAYVASPAFALDCKNGNYGSDECWTNVQVSSVNTTPVRIGTVLVYDYTEGDDALGFVVKASTASTDSFKVAGVAQSVIVSGDRGNILVRGRGKLQVANTATSSGDRLYTSSTAGQAGKVGGDFGITSHDRQIAFALANSTATATLDAYITVI